MSDLTLHGENVEGLCVKMAKQHVRNGLQFDDLLQQARMGAVIAAQSFDPSKGAKFSTHAYMSIRAYCQQAVQANRAASGSSRLAQALFHKLPACQRALQAQGLVVNPHNIAEWLEANSNWSVSTREVQDALQVVKERAVSMSKPSRDRDSDKVSFFGDTLVSREMSQHEKLVRTRRAEAIRDAMLQISGDLNLQGGGLTIKKFAQYDLNYAHDLSLIHISEPTRRRGSRMPSSA